MRCDGGENGAAVPWKDPETLQVLVSHCLQSGSAVETFGHKQRGVDGARFQRYTGVDEPREHFISSRGGAEAWGRPAAGIRFRRRR